MSRWNETTIATLRELWPDKTVSCSMIASELGMTRNAVIGKARRLGLGEKPSIFRCGRTARYVPPKPKQPKRRKPVFVWAAFVKPEPFVPRTVEAAPSLSKSILSLAGNDCRFATHDDAETGEHRFCGHPSENGKPYCEAHCLIAYQAPRNRAEAAARGRQHQVSRYRAETTSWMAEEAA